MCTSRLELDALLPRHGVACPSSPSRCSHAIACAARHGQGGCVECWGGHHAAHVAAVTGEDLDMAIL